MEGIPKEFQRALEKSKDLGCWRSRVRSCHTNNVVSVADTPSLLALRHYLNRCHG